SSSLAGTEIAARSAMTHRPSSALPDLKSLLTFMLRPESRRKHLDLIRSERLQPYLFIAFTLWLVGVVEIVQKLSGQRLDPRFWMLIAVAITAYSGIQIFRLSRRPGTSRRRAIPHALDKIIDRTVSRG